MQLLKPKQWAALLAVSIALSVVVYVAIGGLEKNLVYYWTPQDLLHKGEQAQGSTVRLGGLVQKGSINWDAKNLHLIFRLGTEAQDGAFVLVSSTGTPPQMFQEGIGAVVEGRFDGKTFYADRVLVKHSNEYRPPTPGEDPKELYRTLLSSSP